MGLEEAEKEAKRELAINKQRSTGNLIIRSLQNHKRRVEIPLNPRRDTYKESHTHFVFLFIYLSTKVNQATRKTRQFSLVPKFQNQSF